MSLNPGGQNYGWNYSRPDREGYSLQLVGTVVSLQEVQSRAFNMGNPGQPGAPEFWPDGNPKMNIRMGLATETGELKAFVFTPAGKQARAGKKASIHMDLWRLSGGNITDLIGKTIVISTQEGQYHVGHPRPWFVELLENTGPFQLSSPLPEEFKVPRLLADSSASGGQVQPPQPQQFRGYGQQPMQQPMQQPVQQYGGFQQQPPMQRPYHQAQPQQVNQQWNNQQPVRQPQAHQQQWSPQAAQPQMVPQAQQQAMAPQPQVQPGGVNPMDPQIMEAMQAVGATSYEVIPAPQPVGDAVGGGQVYEDVYDEDLPFDGEAQ